MTPGCAAAEERVPADAARDSGCAGGTVLIVSHAAEHGGAEQGMLDLAAHLGPGRCRVVLFQDGPVRQALQAHGVKVRVLQAAGAVLGVRRAAGLSALLGAGPGAMRLVRALAREAQGCRLIYANTQKAAAIAMPAGLLARRPVVWHLHDILDASHFGWAQRRLMAAASRLLAREVIVVSGAARAAFLASGGGRNVRTVLNGVDAAPYAGLAAQPRGVLRARLGLPAGPLVGLFGRITAWKGQAVLIEALTALSGVQAMIVGAPLFGEAAEEARLRALALRLGVAERVHFLGHRTDVPALMRAADLVVHCSTAPEPFGRVIVEALLAGTPVLAADAGASREILGETAWLVKPGDPAALAGAIAQLLAQDTSADVARLRARMQANFTLPRAVADYERIIARAMAGRGLAGHSAAGEERESPAPGRRTPFPP